MMTGISRARTLDLKAQSRPIRLKPSAFLGKLIRFPTMAMMIMQNRQMRRPGTIPAAKSPAIDVPISDP